MKFVAFAAAALFLSAPASALSPSQFVIFGDSFIDAGAVWEFTGRAQPSEALGFWQGRFSDGPTWADLLGYANLGYATPDFYGSNPPGTIPGLPGFVYTPGASNFAVGGARASGDDGLIPGLPSQLGLYGQYLAATGTAVDPAALYIINFGNNDVTLLEELAGDPAAQAAAAAAYVGNMVDAVVGLSSFGATNILLLGVPNPTEALGVALQAQLDLQLDAIEPGLAFAGTTLTRFDYFAFFNGVNVDPTRYGLPAGLITDQSRFCLGELAPGSDCSNYLSFDGIHVTRGVHQALAFEIAREAGLIAVPEPATWGLMIIGFGAVGFAMRRRTAHAV